MKAFLTALAFFASAVQALACECGEAPLPATPAVERAMALVLPPGASADVENGIWLRAFPTAEDRRELNAGMRGSSCHAKGPRGEDLFACAARTVSDVRIPVVRRSGARCTVDLRVVSTFERARARVLRNRCR